MIERVVEYLLAVNAINYVMYFVVVTLLFQLLAKHSSAANHVSDLLTSTSTLKQVRIPSFHYAPHPHR